MADPQPPDAVEVFYSYSHKDEELRDQLETHLAMLKRESVIKGWHDRRISAGREWAGQIDAHLNSADIILLLVSSDFLASDYCYDIEVRRAMIRYEAKEARVIPIILRPCDWSDAPFGKLQALPKNATPVTLWPNQDQAFLDIAKGIRKAAEEISASKRVPASSTEEPPADESSRPNPALYIPDPLRVDFVRRKDFTGDDIVERLKDELGPSKKRLIALWGFGGVGKTAIAAEVARDLVEAYEQRVVWTSADGRADYSLSTLLDEIATQLRQPELRKLTLELKREQVRELVQEAPTLVLLDNFETITPEEEAKSCVEWLSQPALCAALITTRDKVEEARNFPLNPMSFDEARTLLQRLIAQAHEPRAFANLDYDRVIRTADFNPLVLQWIFGQIDLAQDPDEVLDDLKHGEGSAAERVFDRSFNLKQLDKGGRAVLLALSLFAPSAMRKALADVAGLGKEKDKKKYKDAVKTLSALWLIRAAEDSQRLVVEGLTRELTRARMAQDSSGAAAFRRRFVARFRQLAESSSRPTAEHLNAVEAERDNILSAMDVAFETGDGESLLRIRFAVGQFLIMRGHWDEAIRSGEQALDVARTLSNEKWVAIIAHIVAITYQHRGEVSKARRLYGESLEIKKRVGDQNGVADTLHQQAMLAQEQGDIEEARRLYGESLEIRKRVGDQNGVANTLHNLAAIVLVQGDIEEARRLYGESLEIKKRVGDQNGVAASLHQLGTISFVEGEFGQADNLYSQSLTLLRKLGHKQFITECLESIGNLRVAQNNYAEARRLFDEALGLAEAVKDKFRIASIKRSLGLLAEKENEKARAAELLGEALRAFEELKSPKAEETRRDLERLEGESS